MPLLPRKSRGREKGKANHLVTVLSAGQGCMNVSYGSCCGVIADIVQQAISRAKTSTELVYMERFLHALSAAQGLRTGQRVDSLGGDAAAGVKGCSRNLW